MNIYEYLILVEGKDKTSEIESCEYRDTNYYILYENNSTEERYEKHQVQKLGNPKEILTQGLKVTHRGRELSNIKTILQFTEYWKVIFGNGKSYFYLRKNLVVERSALLNQEIKDYFQYFKLLSEQVSIKTDEGTSLLASQYKKINFVSEKTALATYLTPGGKGIKGSLPNCIIYPFGCNRSQMQAVERTLSNQISVIEGPPGTGKTQTILNIIANILLEGKTVAVVSNNNSAIDNVLEKLEKTGFGFITASLGKSKNKELFIKEQTGLYPDWSGYKKDNDEDKQLRTKVVEQQESLKEMLHHKNQIAMLKSELAALSLEQKYFEEYYEETYQEVFDVKDFSHLKTQQILNLWIQAQIFAKRERRLSLWFKIKGVLGYKIFSISFFRKSIDEIIAALQYMYYFLKLKELKHEIDDLEKRLSMYDFETRMEELTKCSNKIFKAAVAKKYGGRCERPMFKEEDLWKRADDFCKEYPVILSTTYSLKNSLSKEIIYDYVIVDEASQVDLTTGVLTLSCARNVVIVGDLMQLPNVVPDAVKEMCKNIPGAAAIKEGYRYELNSLLSSIGKVIEDVPKTLLREHYRCHPKIIEFCNQKFYNNQLVVMTEDYEEEDVLKVYKTVKGNHARGHLNQRQIDEIEKNIIPELSVTTDRKDIGIIAPYKQQTQALREHMDEEMEISTVHKFQGREKDAIIISTVDNEISQFTDNPNLLNVAVSRAKKRLRIILSDSEKNDKTNIGDLVKYIQYNNFEVVKGEIYSVFDLLYADYTKQRHEYLKKHGLISEYDSENLMYGLIKEILEEMGMQNLDVSVHQPLKMLIRNTEKLSDIECKYVMNPATHLDFVIYNKLDKLPVIAVEVDGYAFHQAGTRQAERDTMKDAILRKYEITLVRCKTNGSGEKENIKRALIHSAI